MRKDGVTIEDVAARAGVSPSTASRVVTGRKAVRSDLAERVRRAVAELGYRPNVAARGLRQSRTMSLGLVFHNLIVPTQLELIKGIESTCQPAGYSLLVTDCRSDDALYRSMVQRLYERRVDGLFLVAPGNLGQSLDDYSRARLPVLALQTKTDADASLPLVSTSERRAIREAVGLLRRLGHLQIGQVAGAWEGRRERLLADAVAAASPAGLTVGRVPRGGSDAEVAQALARLIESPPRPTALFVNLQHLTSVLRGLRTATIRVPEDVSLVSIGDAPWLEFAQPSIASVSVDWEALGMSAANTMLEWISGKPPRPVSFATRATFERRGSVGAACSGD